MHQVLEHSHGAVDRAQFVKGLGLESGKAPRLLKAYPPLERLRGVMQFFSEECAADSSNDSPSRFECKRAARFILVLDSANTSAGTNTY